MQYAYATKSAPRVGTGFGGLPSRKLEGATAKTSPISHKYDPSFLPGSNGIGAASSAVYNEILYGLTAIQNTSGNYANTWIANLKSLPPFTIGKNVGGGGSSYWGRMHRAHSNICATMLSYTFGGESNYSTTTKIFGFDKEYIYSATSGGSTTSVYPGFFVDYDASYMFCIALDSSTNTACVTKINKESMSIVATNNYSARTTPIKAWVKGGSLFILDNTPTVVEIDTSSLSVISAHTYTTLSSLPANSGAAIMVAETSETIGFLSADYLYAYVLDKTTLSLYERTVPYDFGMQRYCAIFECNDKLHISTYSYNSSTYIHTGVIESLLAGTYKTILSISGNQWSQELAALVDKIYANDKITFQGLQLSTPLFFSGLTNFTTDQSAPSSFSGNSLTISPYTTTGSLSAKTKTPVSVIASSGTNRFTTFAKYPYYVS